MLCERRPASPFAGQGCGKTSFGRSGPRAKQLSPAAVLPRDWQDYFGLLWLKLRRQALNDLYRFEADADDLADEADDVFGVFRAVGIGGDAGAFVGADLVLVDDP